jgi:hypothetical protein
VAGGLEVGDLRGLVLAVGDHRQDVDDGLGRPSLRTGRSRTPAPDGLSIEVARDRVVTINVLPVTEGVVSVSFSYAVSAALRVSTAARTVRKQDE